MKPCIERLEEFLNRVDNMFPIPISKKQDLHLFAIKLCEKATLCIEVENEKIISMVAGYTENVLDNRAYISIVATVPDAQGRGLASKLVQDFIQICSDKNIDAVHLYAVQSNIAAVRMYKKIGFEEWIIPDEPRKDDVHLIYYLN